MEKMCSELTPIYFYFHLIDSLEKEPDVQKKLHHLEMIRLMKDRCDKSLINIRHILHGNI